MKKYFKNIGLILALIHFLACSPYEEFITDFDFSIVYFGTQRPLRTIVAYDDMNFKVGVALGGKRTNEVNEIVEFEVDPSLLSDSDIVGNNEFELLPQEYYAFSNDVMVVNAGTFIGDVTVTLNRDAFTDDPLATGNHYALPIRITNTSTDSVAVGVFDETGNAITAPKDYTIVVVKYISPLHGTYYKQGIQVEVGNDGEVIGEEEYNNPDIIRNPTWNLATINRFSVSTSGVGTFGNVALILSLDEESNEVSVSSESPGIFGLSGTGTYDPENRTFDLEYSFQREGRQYEVTELLTIRQAPENDLRFEEW
ncbi:MAG: DUF1735 domain-containing protein [Mongoliibacter sp.]|uniref:DUF1735 domain-containing protein n=1 Tax=Mongoliibacter sp. TaxID=2022438 RepID=UPI0012F28E3E|nr:DUF1735 domain-containing protein [Mongoliibacter sp.]TVP52347.1 MAG: DUF1735 domain-containing protein [Mongoliibacter sp.]